MREWALALLAQLDPDREAALSCDGKTVKGSLREGSEVAHLLSVFTHDLGVTPGKQRAGQKELRPCGSV